MTRRLIHSSKFLFLLSFLLSLVVYHNTSFAEGTFTHPFSSDSIWNTPIANGAEYVPAGFSTANQNIFSFEEISIHKVDLANPLRNVHRKFELGYCLGSSNIDTGITYFQVNIPDSLIYDKKRSNGIISFTFPDGRVKDGYVWERCSNGSYAAQWASGGAWYHVTDDGHKFAGVHGGSFLNALGGTIRKGEWITAPGVPIPHALKLAVSNRVQYYNASDPTPGYRWPAYTADGNASTAYKGTNPEAEMGALYAIHPSQTEASLGLKTEAGKKIFHALQTYGGYTVDSCCEGPWQAWMIGVEINTNRDLVVHKELQNTYGITLTGTNQASIDFKSDMDALYNNLMIVSNANETTPKGPWTSTDSTPPTAPKGLRIQQQ